MMRTLNFETRAARNGAGTGTGSATSLILFFHGYGANGADLLGLADPLAQHLPRTAFVAPDAPEPCAGNPFGFQWFPIPWLDGAPQALADASLDRSAGDLNRFIDDRMAEAGVTADRTALIGFSQGTMMALHVGLRRAEPLAGIVGFSGRLLRPEALAADLCSRPPVLLIHGDADPVVPYGDMARAEAALTTVGVPVASHTSRGVAHGIAPDGLAAALRFLQARLT